jgi:hypothetical protein
MKKMFWTNAGDSVFKQLDRLRGKLISGDGIEIEYLPSIVKWFENSESRADEQEQATLEIWLDR